MPGILVTEMENTAVGPWKDALHSLLQRAKDLKPHPGIEPALNANELDGVGKPLEHTKAQLPIRQQKNSAAIETAIRDDFYRLLASAGIDDDAFGDMWNLLDIVSYASDREYCEAGLPFALIEELLDSQTIHGCRKVFDYLESRRKRMTLKHWKAKNLALLRTCNELLRRLSRAEDTVFCGRVFIFLFQSFPLGDKSSVNLRGEYHTDNVTIYDQTLAKQDEVSEAMEVEVKAFAQEAQANAKAEVTDTQTDATVIADERFGPTPTIRIETKEERQTETMSADALYPLFWSIQEYFAQPTKLFDATNLEAFKMGLQATLAKFREANKDHEPRPNSRNPDENKQGTKRKLDNLDGVMASAFNPKYLTSRDLFELEIGDLAFRRHVLVQSLIVADFLLSQTTKAKMKLESLRNKSVIYDFTLDEENAEWVTKMRADIAAYLQQGVEGKFYYRMVDTVLARDKNWLRWKAEGCPPFQLPPVAPDAYVEARKNIQVYAAPKRLKAKPMGALDFSFLSDKAGDDPLEKLRNPERYAIPPLESFRGSIQDDDFDLSMAQDKEEKERIIEMRASKLWRALRIASRSRFSVFDKLDDGKILDPLWAEPGSEEADCDRPGKTDGVDEAEEVKDDGEEAKDAAVKEDAVMEGVERVETVYEAPVLSNQERGNPAELTTLSFPSAEDLEEDKTGPDTGVKVGTADG